MRFGVGRRRVAQRFRVGGWLVLGSHVTDEPSLGYVETVAGELFLESGREINRLTTVHDS